MSKIHFNNTFSGGCVQFMAADWPATTAHKMINLLTSSTVIYENRSDAGLTEHNIFEKLQIKNHLSSIMSETCERKSC